ncbi:MAG: arylsulfatase [Verrucomicrobiota bacterium]
MKLFLTLLSFCTLFLSAGVSADKPNMIFILADDLGYGDLGCFGQEKIRTPRLDAMAAEGMKFSQFYSGSTVCAPSRCVLMTGQDTGNCWVRGNSKDPIPQTLPDADITVAEKLKEAGYSTALIGKWGLGELGSAGHPNKQGFDYFFGYLNQRHAHNFYPEFLIRNSEVAKLENITSPLWEEFRVENGFPEDGAGFATPEGKKEYSHDLFVEEVHEWIGKQAKEESPFFLYLALTVPHANNEAGRVLGDGQEVPDYGIYAEENWPDPDKGQAAMITRMDTGIGAIVDQLKDLGIDEETLIFFTSDNGHHKEGGNDPEFFDANGPLRGMKRDLTEGGIRVPTLAYWPSVISPGTVTDHISGFTDWMATACELAGVEAPPKTQSVSFAPTLRGETEKQREHDFLYWEFYEKGSKQALRFGPWKAIRKPMFTGEIELYNVEVDLGEEKNVATENPDVIAKAAEYFELARTPNPMWKIRK